MAMQPLAQQGLTAEEVRAILHAPERQIDFRYELLDGQNRTKQANLRGVLAASVANNALAEIKRTARFTIMDGLDDIDYLRDRIRPWVRVRAERQPLYRDWSSDPLGQQPRGTRKLFDDDPAVWLVKEKDGHRVLEASVPPGEASEAFLVIEDPGTPVDVDIVAKVRATSETFGVFAISEEIVPGYFAGLYTGEGGPSLVLNSFGEGFLEAPFEVVPGDYYWIRLRCEGTLFSATAWRDGDPGPSGWMLQGNSEFPPGPKVAGIATFLIDDWTADFAYVGIGLRGQEAPMEPTGPETVWLEWPQGVFLLSSPTRRADEAGGVIREIEAYDQLVILRDDRVLDRYVIRAGTNYISAVDDLLQSAGIQQRNLFPSPLTLPADREWAPGTPKLEIVNDLLQAINYRSLTFDALGVAVAEPYVSPADQSPEYRYADDRESVLLPEATETLDLFDVANAWVLVVSDPDREPIVATYRNDSPQSPTSTVNRGRVIVDYREYEEAADEATLQARAERIAFEASQVVQAIEWESWIMPHHGDSDVYELVFSPLGVAQKFSEHTWEMDLRVDGRMKHRARRVIPI